MRELPAKTRASCRAAVEAAVQEYATSRSAAERRCQWARVKKLAGSKTFTAFCCAIRKSGGSRHINNVELGRHGRNRSNLWCYRGLNSFGTERDELLASHPTVKPVLLIANAIRDVTRRGDPVLDTFLGSGSTLIAAEETGRVCFGVDLDHLYVDVAVRRWQNHTKRDALLAGTNTTFDEAAAARRARKMGNHR